MDYYLLLSTQLGASYQPKLMETGKKISARHDCKYANFIIKSVIFL